jgi:hypothetical protein
MNIKKSNFHTALGFEFSIPVVSAQNLMSGNELEYEPYILFALDFPGFNNAQLFSQLGMELNTGGEENENASTYINMGVFIPLNFGVFVTELNCDFEESLLGDENELYITMGFVKNFSRGWEFGFGIPVGLNSSSDKFGLIMALSFEFDI